MGRRPMTEMPSPRSSRRVSPRGRRLRHPMSIALVAIVAMVLVPLQAFKGDSAAAAGPCGPPVVSVIACENTQPGIRRATGR